MGMLGSAPVSSLRDIDDATALLNGGSWVADLDRRLTEVPVGAQLPIAAAVPPTRG